MQNTSMQGSTPTATSAAEHLSEQASGALHKVNETAHQAMERVSRAASGAASRLSERSEELMAMQGRAMESARAYIRDHPFATVGIALAVGMLLSRLTSRR